MFRENNECNLILAQTVNSQFQDNFVFLGYLNFFLNNSIFIIGINNISDASRFGIVSKSRYFTGVALLVMPP